MAGAGGTEVGRINVRVVPDLDEFYQKLEKAVKKYDNSTVTIKVDADVSEFVKDVEAARRGLDSTIDVGADVDEFRRDVEAATDDLNGVVDLDANTKKVRKQVDKATKGLTAKVKVDADTGEAETSLDRWQRRYLARVEKILESIDVSVDLTPEGEATRKIFQDQARELRKSIKKIDLTADLADIADARFDVDEAFAKFRKNAYESNLLIEELRKQVNNVFSDANSKKDLEPLQLELDTRIAAFQAQQFFTKLAREKLEVELRPKIIVRERFSERVVVPVKIQADFDRGGLIRNVAIASAATRQFATAAAAPFRLLTAFPGILAKGFARLGPEVVALTALIAAILPPVIALIAGATTLAPALLAALVPIGAIALGLEGITRAAEAARPAFDDLRKSISDVFEFGLPGQQSMTAGFKTLAEQVIPNVKASLQNVAQSLNNQFNAVVGVLASPKGIANLNNIFDNVAKGLDNAKAGLKGFTSGLLELISAISNKFPGLGTWFSELGEKFAGWVEKFTTIKDSNGLTALERTIQNVRTGIEGLTGVFQAFFSQGLKDIQDPNFGAGMKSFFDSVKSFVTNTLPALSQGFLEVVNLLKQMEPLFNLIGGASNLAQLMVNPGQAISDAVSRFKKGGIKEALTGVGRGDDDPFKELPNQAAQAAAESKKALQDGLKVEGWFGGKGDVAANATSQALDNVKSQVSSQVQAAITEAQTSLQALAPLLQTAIDSAVEPLNQLPTKLGESFALLGASFGGAWDAITSIVTERAAGITTAITTAFESIPQKLMGSFAMLGAAVGGAMAGLRGVIASNLGGITDAFGQAFAGVAGRVASVLSAVPGAVAAALSPTIGVVQQVMLGVINVISVSAQQIIGLASTAFSQFAPVVQAAMAPAITAVSTICQQMVDTAMSYASVMENSGRAIGAAFAAGLASTGGIVKAAATALMDAARPLFPNSPAKEGPFSGSGWVDKSGESVGEAFAAGMNKSMPGVVSTARELMQAVKDIFGSAEGLTLNFNMGPVTQQLGQVAAATQTFQDTLATTAKTATGFQDSISTVVPSGEVDLSRKTELDQLMRQLEMERKALEIQKAQGVGDQAAIKARLEEIRLQKLQIGLQQNQLTYAEKYGAAAGGTAEHYSDLMKKAQDLPTDFAKATGQQFMQDLGMSGNGMIPSLLEQGTQYIFQVANMDTAMSAHQTLQRKQALGLVGR